VNQEILKVQKPLSIMNLNCQYVIWQDIKLLAVNKIFNKKSTKFCSPYNSEISFRDYFLVYHRAKQRAILRNGNMGHFTFIDRTPFEKVII
jgi:hypothetical protein